MKKYKNTSKIIIFMMTLCMLFAAACSKNTSSPLSDQKNTTTEAPKTSTGTIVETQQTTSGEPTIKVTPPEGWSPVDGTTAILQYISANGSSFIVTADGMPGTANTPDAYVDFVKGQFSNLFDDTKFADTENVTVAGIEGRKLIFTCKVSGFEMKYHVYYVFKNNIAYTFTCGTLSTQFDELSGDYEAFMKSVTFE